MSDKEKLAALYQMDGLLDEGLLTLDQYNADVKWLSEVPNA